MVTQNKVEFRNSEMKIKRAPGSGNGTRGSGKAFQGIWGGGLFSFSFDFLFQLIYARLQIVKILRKEMIMRLGRGWVSGRM